MAALLLFTRFKLSANILRYSPRNPLVKNTLPNLDQVQQRWGSYKSSPPYEERSKYTDFEVTRNPDEWAHVECLLKPKTVPLPPLENKHFPSGWKPPISKPGDYPYYVQRSRNYMIPVYLLITYRGMRRVTVIRKIQGDIWTLESELKGYLEKATGKPVGVRVNELVGEIRFRGDYVSLVQRWMFERGF